MAEFVEGWFVAQVLGEGAYGEVRLLVHARSGAAVALKMARGPDAAREAALQRALRHPHVLRCLGDRTHHGHHYMFLEYAQGGDLFDRIEPDIGMGEVRARRYWAQTLRGVEYLHSRGVAHRDLKPENLLLDAHDRVKISDFGMATVFRHEDHERLLTRVCGTVPYAAPEVLRAQAEPYRAPPADVWAAAMVLVAMLAGELPWERAEEADERYAAWTRRHCHHPGPWRKVSPGALALLRPALEPRPDRRLPVRYLLEHPWIQDRRLPVRNLLEHPWTRDRRAERTWRSQPAPEEARDLSAADMEARDLSAADMEALLSHSQPARPDEFVVVAPRLVRRLTRLWVRCSVPDAVAALRRALHERGFACRDLHPRLLAVDCGDGVRMRAWAIPRPPHRPIFDGNARALLEFRRSRGCGLRFKRRFLELSEALRPLAADPPPKADLFAEPLAEPLTEPLVEPLTEPLVEHLAEPGPSYDCL